MKQNDNMLCLDTVCDHVFSVFLIAIFREQLHFIDYCYVKGILSTNANSEIMLVFIVFSLSGACLSDILIYRCEATGGFHKQ